MQVDLNNLVNRAPYLIFHMQISDGKYLYVNDAAEKITGYSENEWYENPFLIKKIIHPGFRDFFEKEWKNLLSGSMPDEYEFMIVSRNGNEKWVLQRNFIIRDENGIPQAVEGIVTDITERKLSEYKLLENMEYISSIFRSAPVGIGLVKNRILQKINFRLSQITGYSEEELIGKSARILYPDESEFEFVGREKYEQIRNKGTGTVETKWVRKDGKMIDVLLSSTPIDLNDFSRGVTFTALDITESVANAKEREKLQEQLNQAQKLESIGRLAGGVAHDFNNIIGVIMGHSELAMETLDETHDLFRDLLEIRKAAEKSAEITRQLLAFARKQTVSPKNLDLNRTVDGMLKMLRRLIGEDISISWRPAEKEIRIMMDPVQIDQIMANLCVNARDAITDVGKLIIETEAVFFDREFCRMNPGYLAGWFACLSVSDNGCGMDRETMANIFEPFFTTKETGKGTGLGLSTVYGIVKQNNGFIKVYSEPETGTTFRIFIPLCSELPSEADEIEEMINSGPCNGTVLVVEDDQAILEITCTILKMNGFTPLMASAPGRAIQIAESYDGKIDLLLTDVVMPEMNGPDLACTLLARFPHLSCLFMSGYTADVIAHHGVLDKEIDFLQKPFSSRKLIDKISEILKRNSSVDSSCSKM